MKQNWMRFANSRQIVVRMLAATAHFSSTGSTRAAKLGISFSPAGLLTPFHLGASAELRESQLLTDSVALAGSSGGALAAVCAGLDVDVFSSLEACSAIARRCRDLGHFGQLRPALDEQLYRILPQDAHTLLNTRAALTSVAYKQLFPSLVSHTVSAYTSKEDLIEVLRASCAIPVYFNGTPAVRVRDHYGIDGFFAVDRNRFGCPPTGAVLEIVVCPFRADRVGLAIPEVHFSLPIHIKLIILFNTLPCS